MGLLSEGSALSWEETKKNADHVRAHGIKQFVNQFKKLHDRTKDVLYWGDEVIIVEILYNISIMPVSFKHSLLICHS